MNGEDVNRPEEPVTFVDKRKIDPDSGEVREVAPETGAAPQPADEVEVEVAPDRASVELAERTADLQRLQAEYANYRRRVQRDRQSDIDAAKASVVLELLGVIDDLERAKAHGDLESGPLKSVADKLSGALAKQGLTDFGAEGEPFDPKLHEAVQHEGEGSNAVLGAVLRKGYRIGDRVLRHAMVAVTDGVPEASGANTPGSGENAGSDAPTQQR